MPQFLPEYSSEKNYENPSIFARVIEKIKVAPFLMDHYVEVICIDVNVSAKFVNVACKMTKSVLQVSKYWQLSSVEGRSK